MVEIAEEIEDAPITPVTRVPPAGFESTNESGDDVADRPIPTATRVA